MFNTVTVLSTFSPLKSWLGNSLYFLPYSLYDISLENLVFDQLIIPKLIFFFILITCVLDIVLIQSKSVKRWRLTL